MPDLELVWSFGETDDRETTTHLLHTMSRSPDVSMAHAFCGYIRTDLSGLDNRTAKVTLLRCYLNPATCSECNNALAHERLLARRGQKTVWDRLLDES